MRWVLTGFAAALGVYELTHPDWLRNMFRRNRSLPDWYLQWAPYVIGAGALVWAAAMAITGLGTF